MQLDVMDLIFAPSSFRQNNCLSSGTLKTWQYVSPVDERGLQHAIYIKGANGYPWDWMTVTPNYICQRLTEESWTDPATGKLYLGVGARRFPRWISVNPFTPEQLVQVSFTLQPPETNYLIFTGTSIVEATNGLCRCTFSGPYVGAVNGDLVAGTDWKLEYERDGKLVNGSVQYAAKEVLMHREGYGRYQWQQFDLDPVTGLYKTTPTASSLDNKIITAPCPTPQQLIF